MNHYNTELRIVEDCDVLDNVEILHSENFSDVECLTVPVPSLNIPALLRGSFRTCHYGSTDDADIMFKKDDEDEVTLMLAKHERVPMKDFHSEIRASMDVERFLSDTILILDLYETNLPEIVDCILRQILQQTHNEVNEDLINEAKENIFTHDRVSMLARTIQGTSYTDGGGFDYDQSWICILCTLPVIQKRQVAIVRLKYPANLGRTSQEIRLIVFVIASPKEKGTKNALETARTFATIFADIDFRLSLLEACNENDFKRIIWEHTKELCEQKVQCDRKHSIAGHSMFEEEFEVQNMFFLGRGIRGDLRRRIPHYISDYKDGVIGHRTVEKLISTTMFLYFACLLPSIALGMLYDNNTSGAIGIRKTIYAQTIGGIMFALVGGQPLIVLLTTAPLALYTKIIYSICEQLGLDFVIMYVLTGWWNSFYLVIYSLFNVSRLMKWSTKSTEEIFAVFISIAFTVDAIKDVVQNYVENYASTACQLRDKMAANATVTYDGATDGGDVAAVNGTAADVGDCLRENALLYLLLTLGTLWLAVALYNFTKTPFLNAAKRELLADYALPVSVMMMAFMGSYVFRDIKLTRFNMEQKGPVFSTIEASRINWRAVVASAGLALPLSLLFFIDQNISSSMINAPSNKLRKGPAYHWDLLVVAVLNAFLSAFTLPWMHAALPHSPLHVRALADFDERVDQGHVHRIVVRVRETRLTGICSHVLIGLSLLMIPYPLSYIPRAVLDGLFLYVAYSALANNQMFERIMLLFTEQSAYPPTHYIRRVPQRKIHMFTIGQLLQLGVLCAAGFAPYPYVKIVFPILIMLLIPVRHNMTPHIIEEKYLDALDKPFFVKTSLQSQTNNSRSSNSPVTAV